MHPAALFNAYGMDKDSWALYLLYYYFKSDDDDVDYCVFPIVLEKECLEIHSYWL